MYEQSEGPELAAKDYTKSPVQTANHELQEAISYLDKGVGLLEEKLRIVLTFPDPTPEPSRLDAVGTLRSDLTAFVLTQTDRVRGLTDRVQRLIDNNDL